MHTEVARNVASMVCNEDQPFLRSLCHGLLRCHIACTRGRIHHDRVHGKDARVVIGPDFHDLHLDSVCFPLAMRELPLAVEPHDQLCRVDARFILP
eukprot:scaffold48759_cov61-Phaeocystis_antarctica.AAC.2